MRKRYRDFYLVLESNTYYIISNVYSTFYRCSLTMHYDLRSLMSLRTMNFLVSKCQSVKVSRGDFRFFILCYCVLE